MEADWSCLGKGDPCECKYSLNRAKLLTLYPQFCINGVDTELTNAMNELWHVCKTTHSPNPHTLYTILLPTASVLFLLIFYHVLGVVIFSGKIQTGLSGHWSNPQSYMSSKIYVCCDNFSTRKSLAFIIILIFLLSSVRNGFPF
jgi:hypothetical protein